MLAVERIFRKKHLSKVSASEEFRIDLVDALQLRGIFESFSLEVLLVSNWTCLSKLRIDVLRFNAEVSHF